MSDLNLTSGSITYSIRESSRTKRLHLKLNRLAEIEVVIPLKTKPTEIENFVNKNLSWINRQRKLIVEKNLQGGNSSVFPPQEIKLSLLDARFSVDYKSCTKTPSFSVDGTNITILANTDEEKRKQLKHFIHQVAKIELSYHLEKLSVNLGLPYNRVFIKSQKTRWGSCSSKKNINLNRNLVFLDLTQVEYLIIHELCHTIHLNHSPRYWKLVSHHCPSYQAVDKSLKQAIHKIPLWSIV